MSLSRTCQEVLVRWSPPDQQQSALRDRYLDHLRSTSDGWSRSCAGQHLTASSLIISPDRDRVLLTLHARIKRWLQTGGHIEAADPDLGAAALREAREESGLADLVLGDLLLLSRHEVPCGPVRPCFHLDVQYLVTGDPDQPPVISDESADVRWFGLDELPELDQSVRDLISAATAAPAG
ncbi:NUDIX hydrolase [Microlunatus soli]|uniref:8-oxo-dGTP pyrophosphatase MutT, NUDIX family n=1 Tax=Microlunatus soli TaxID=630515 RepID=A0A1H1MMM2_9ACTN|nr:NUDIX domain-containing protein [Microlunatus soli]SDR87998.1 8-oxo-dGTP pyrophosphatase MutT, NUDIX family [Microlunatus soli]